MGADVAVGQRRLDHPDRHELHVRNATAWRATLVCRVGAVVSTPEHRALIYHDPAQFTGGAGAFAREGVGAGEHVLAVLTADRQDWLREELGAQAAAAVDFADAAGSS